MTLTLADPHCHTDASDGMVTPAELVEAALGAGLGLIAITDHDTMAAAQEVYERGGERGLAVVKGQEVTSRWPAQTHVLGWFLETPVRGGMTLRDTVRAIQEQGGLAVIPHPFLPVYFASCQPGMLRDLIAAERLDGLEVASPVPTTPGRRRALEAFYAAHAERLGARIGASDSHFGRHDLGRVVTAFEGKSAEDFRNAVVERRTEPVRGQARWRVPAGLIARQQARSLVSLPLRRLRGQLQ